MYIGLVFHSFVTLVVTIVAFILVYELFSRRLTPTMRVYGIFWLITGLLWGQNTLRNAAIGFGWEDFPRLLSSIASQATVYISGIPLFAYIGLKVFKNSKIAFFFSMQTFVVASIATWLLFLPNGIFLEDRRMFTAEATANNASLALIKIEIGAIVLILLLDIIQRLYKSRSVSIPKLENKYEMIYDAAIILYVLVGIIDLMKIISDWGLVIFRVFYCAAFLSVYLTVRLQRESNAQYLVKEENAGG